MNYADVLDTCQQQSKFDALHIVVVMHTMSGL